MESERELAKPSWERLKKMAEALRAARAFVSALPLQMLSDDAPGEGRETYQQSFPSLGFHIQTPQTRLTQQLRQSQEVRAWEGWGPVFSCIVPATTTRQHPIQLLVRISACCVDSLCSCYGWPFLWRHTQRSLPPPRLKISTPLLKSHIAICFRMVTLTVSHGGAQANSNSCFPSVETTYVYHSLSL